MPTPFQTLRKRYEKEAAEATKPARRRKAPRKIPESELELSATGGDSTDRKGDAES
jgi:hypothetical protein